MSESHQGCKVIDNPKKYELEVVECNKCGNHIGIDAIFLERRGSVKMPCPYCGKPLVIPEFE